MLRLFLVMVFFLFGTYFLRAAEVFKNDHDFTSELNTVKNPFEDGLPKAVIVPPPVNAPVIILKAPAVKSVPPPVVLPDLKLQGVFVGDGMHQAIINDQTVPLLGYIEGARLDSISKQGVVLFYKGKRFFLNID